MTHMTHHDAFPIGNKKAKDERSKANSHYQEELIHEGKQTAEKEKRHFEPQ
jgi:hypothetical protein